jgi:hypothetical protein
MKARRRARISDVAVIKTVVQFTINIGLSFVPLLIVENYLNLPMENVLGLFYLILATLTWSVSFYFCLRSSENRKRALWLFVLLPVAWGPLIFMLLMSGIAKRGL